MTLAELLESVRRVEVRTNRLVNDTMVGAYLSHFQGRGSTSRSIANTSLAMARDIDRNAKPLWFSLGFLDS